MMYPYHEDSAGSFKSSNKTGNTSEVLIASNDILSLAEEILNEDILTYAESLAVMLINSSSKKNQARHLLQQVLLPPPKRPIYYLTHELEFLPRWTREALRILGDYIDMLTKAAVFGKSHDRDIFRSSFGPAINSFQKLFPNENQLSDWLLRYNRFLYRDAKHDFKLPQGRREHRFTSREVVLCLFITKELATQMTNLSETALRVSRDEPM
jgi:hypothetical protein